MTAWNSVPLKRWASIRPSNIDKHSVECEQSVRLCNYLDVYRNERITANLELMQATASAAQVERFTLQRNDVIVTKDSETPYDIGIPAHVSSDLPGVVCGYHLSLLRPDAQRLQGGFLFWALQSSAARDYFATSALGITRFALNTKDLEQFPLKAPLPAEQERIANFLDEQTGRIDALIRAKEDLLAILLSARQAYAFSLSTSGIEGQGRYLDRPEPWFQTVPAHWAMPKLGYIAEVGNGSTPRREVAEYWVDGTIPWITSTAVHGGAIESTEEQISGEALRECHLRMIRPGSTIVGLIGQGPTRGMAARLGIAATLSQNVAFATPRHDSQVQDEYLTVALTGLYSAMRYLSDGVGGAHGAMNCDQLRSLRIPLPPHREQAAIVSEFRKREAATAEMRNHAAIHVALLREYRSSLISEAVTGQIDINTYGASPA